MENKKLITFNLPSDSDPNIFGKEFWSAFHKLAAEIPCESCRGEAEKFVIFWHDSVNLKLGKPLYDEKNFNEVFEKINTLKNKNQPYKFNSTMFLNIINLALLIVIIYLLTRKNS